MLYEKNFFKCGYNFAKADNRSHFSLQGLHRDLSVRGKKSRRRPGLIWRPGEPAVVENYSVSFANSLPAAWFIRYQIP